MRKNENLPNVVVFFTDQQRFDSSGLCGNPLDLTPNYDRMALEGTHFINGFTCQPVCGPARACVQTGKYATSVGVPTNGRLLGSEHRTLGHCFREAGYRTGYIGKWHLSDAGGAAVPPEHREGYDYWLGSNVLEFTSEPYKTVMYDNDGQAVRLPGYRVDATADAAISFIDRHQAEPFFLFVAPIEPHFQNQVDDYPAPHGYRERYTGKWTPADLAALGGSTHQHLGGYWGMIKRTDEAFGRMLDALESLELLDNTIVLFTSDHGCHFKTRNSEYKRSCHESSIRVPYAARGPGFDGGGRRQELLSLVDLAPTLLDAAGVEAPADMQGRSIMPVLRRENMEWQREAYVQISESQLGRALRTRRWKYGVDAPDKDPVADSTSERYVEQYLYDLESDPHELRNLIGFDSHQEVTARLRERLIERMAEAGEGTATIEAAEVVKAGQRGAWRYAADC